MSPRTPDHESYAPRLDTSNIVPANEALFTFPDAPDAAGNTPPSAGSSPNTILAPIEWPHVKLADAAIALDGIMKAYNSRSRANGIDTIRNTPDNRFDTLYEGQADEVDGGVDYKAKRLEAKKAEHMSVLADTDRMNAVFGKEQTQWHANRAEDYLDRRFGPGKASARVRAKMVKNIVKIVEATK